MSDQVRWDEHGLIPAIVQDAATHQVLMVAYMNTEALQKTLETGETVFWSRSRGELWHKGATSGNTQRVRDIRLDCDGDTLLIQVEPAGPACHTGNITCFFRDLDGLDVSAQGVSEQVIAGHRVDMIAQIEQIVRDRKINPKPGSYTNQLFMSGVNKIAQKVGEEATEVIVAALGQGRNEQVGELADLFYHLLVLMTQLNLSLDEVRSELARRHK